MATEFIVCLWISVLFFALFFQKKIHRDFHISLQRWINSNCYYRSKYADNGNGKEALNFLFSIMMDFWKVELRDLDCVTLLLFVFNFLSNNWWSERLLWLPFNSFIEYVGGVDGSVDERLREGSIEELLMRNGNF